MHLASSTYLAATMLAVGVIASLLGVLRNSTSKVPGPWYSKWTSWVATWHWFRGNHIYYIHEMHQRYGPIVRIAPNEVSVSDLEAIKAIYGYKQTFPKSPWYQQMSFTSSDNVFNTDDTSVHRRHRKTLAGPMSESNLKHYMGVVHTKVDLAIQRMQEEMQSRGAADVWKWFLFMATDVIGELSFGESFMTLEQGKKSDYTKDLEFVTSIGAVKGAFPTLFRISEFLPVPYIGGASKANGRMQRYARESIDRLNRLVEADPTRAKQTLFTNVLKAKNEETLTISEVHSDAQSYIIAGSDTTANTLTYLVWALCKRPDLKKRLVEELKQLPENFTDADLRPLNFLKHVIEETLRLFSAVPSCLPRAVPAGGVELNGYGLAPGTIVETQPYTMHRNPEVFPEPETFNPDRWASPTKVMTDTFMPFGLGSRVCLGVHLAMAELRMAAARFFLAFPNAKVSTLEGMNDKDMHVTAFFLLVPKGHRCLIQLE